MSTVERGLDVVVGVDGSPASTTALRVAAREAVATGRALRAVHAWRTPTALVGGLPGIGYSYAYAGMLDAHLGAETAKHQLDDELAEVVQSAGGQGQLQVIPDVREGDAGVSLVEASTLADLLVLGSRRHGAFGSAVIGSATNYVLHRAHCPVLIVPAQPGPPQPWAKVLVGVDGSECSRHALTWAADRARAHGCLLVAVHAWLFGTGARGADPQVEVESWLRAECESVLGPDARGLELLVVQDYAAAALLAACEPEDLLVVGTQSGSLLHDVVVGSVAMQCAHHTRGSVVVVRGPQAP